MKNLFFLIIGFCLVASCSRQEKVDKPTYLYKVLSMDDWGKSCKTVHLSSIDAKFIHLSREDQLDKIIEKYWAEASEYVVLKVETGKLSGKLVFEANPGGTNKYYHLYNGSIPLTAICEMTVHKQQK